MCIPTKAWDTQGSKKYKHKKGIIHNNATLINIFTPHKPITNHKAIKNNATLGTRISRTRPAMKRIYSLAVRQVK